MIRCLLLALLVSAGTTCAAQSGRQGLIIASKSFTENVILAEIAVRLGRIAGLDVSHQAALGGSRILWSALLNGEIDAYPDYTGTLFLETLGEDSVSDLETLRELLRSRGIGATEKLGFNNTYVIGMLEEKAARLNIETISDLREHETLSFAFSNEFMDRADGWWGLRAHYTLPQQDAQGVDHDLAYRALASGSIDAMELYSTDADIRYYNIRSLKDDKAYFPDYHALFLYRLDTPRKLVRQLQALEGRVDNETMISMNAAVKLDGRPETLVAAGFIEDSFGIRTEVETSSAWQRFLVNTREHLALVGISLLAAIILALPLGIFAAKRPVIGQFILGLTGILQTIPSLAMFVFMIPFLGIGAAPTIAALFVYSLLPIVRNTCSGLQDIPASIRDSAKVIGLPARSILRQVELPLATRTILAGIKTAAVINVGTATLGAFVGAGGYGQPILTGIRLDDTALILEGAVPAALLALLVQFVFEFIEKRLLPAPLRYQAGTAGHA